MQSHIDKLDKDLEAFRVITTFARDIAGYLSEDCILAVSQSSIVVYCATRADLKLIMSLKRGEAWKKSNPGDGDVRYSTWVTLSTGMGDVLTVLAVDLPYITARIENRLDHHSRYSFVFDTRRTQFMELSREYVASICPHLTIVYESTNPPC